MAVLQDLTKLSHDQLVARVLEMQTERQRKITCKVSEKGALSVYGMGRFPVTLYVGQWERLLDPATIAQIKAFIAANVASLKTKD